MKVVINYTPGGFSLSPLAMKRLRELGSEAATREPIYPGEKYSNGSILKPGSNYSSFHPDIARADPLLIQVVEELGKEANTSYSDLLIVEIPDGIKYHIHEYDGLESIHEEHRSWPEDDCTGARDAMDALSPKKA
jgi:hypothetical protein